MSPAARRSPGGEGTGTRGRAAAPVRRARAPGPQRRATAKAVRIGSRDREQMIAEAAYYRAERRNFAGGREMDDWLAVEEEIDSLINPVRESIDEAENIGPIP
jgi:hypothetical protein